MLNSSTIFEINEVGFLLTLLDSGETRSQVFFHLRDFYGHMETYKRHLNQIHLKTH